MKSIVLFASILRIVLITMIISFAVYANAQNVAINTSGNSADASAMLDVSSSSKGFLPPRMTTIQRTGISSPAHGLMVYDTDTKTYWYFSTTWKEISNGGGGGGSFALPYSGVADNTAPAFSVTNTNTSFGSSAVFGRVGSTPSGVSSLGNAGVWGDNAGGIGIAGTSKSIGVFGATGLSDLNGIGVLGITSSTAPNVGAVTAINQSKGIAVYAESLDSGTAVYGKTKKQNGAAIYGINNSVQGHGVRGAAAANDGVGIYGDAGISNSNSYAGYFRNWNSANSKNVVQIDNLGTGNFLSMTNGLGDTKATIAKNGQINTDGNIYTQGDLYVNGLKGIVRNTYSNQMRMEVMNVTIPGGFHFVVSGEFVATQNVTVTFNTPFAQAPAVYRANLVSPANSAVEFVNFKIYDVTTTGFKINLSPNPNLDFVSDATTFKFVVVGND
ncbi:MAG TPA: hypothetical protein VFP97_02065 [Chitinophagaceae bacterium]|nr:hypothetical protein [Chitinophagaceae bacterium]